MAKCAVVGIGGPGGKIVEYLHPSLGESFQSFILDNDQTHHPKRANISYLDEQQISNQDVFNSFLEKIIDKDIVSVIALSGFQGIVTLAVQERLIEYCSSNNLPLCFSGTTPFSFQGLKALKEVNAQINSLRERGVVTESFANADLKDKIDALTSLEDALNINFERILQEVVLPEIEKEAEIEEIEEFEVYEVEPVVTKAVYTIYKTPLISRIEVRVAVAILAFILGFFGTYFITSL